MTTLRDYQCPLAWRPVRGLSSFLRTGLEGGRRLQRRVHQVRRHAARVRADRGRGALRAGDVRNGHLGQVSGSRLASNHAYFLKKSPGGLAENREKRLKNNGFHRTHPATFSEPLSRWMPRGGAGGQLAHPPQTRHYMLLTPLFFLIAVSSCKMRDLRWLSYVKVHPQKLVQDTLPIPCQQPL